MFRNTMFVNVVVGVLHRLIFVKIHACLSNHIPEPHYHKTNVKEKRFFKERINKISAAESEQTRQNILRISLLPLEQV